MPPTEKVMPVRKVTNTMFPGVKEGEETICCRKNMKMLKQVETQFTGYWNIEDADLIMTLADQICLWSMVTPHGAQCNLLLDRQ